MIVVLLKMSFIQNYSVVLQTLESVDDTEYTINIRMEPANIRSPAFLRKFIPFVGVFFRPRRPYSGDINIIIQRISF